jgi:hypothetical protein
MSLTAISAHAVALGHAMEQINKGTRPDSVKWNSVNTFVRKYCQLARRYITLSGDTNINMYDVSKLKLPLEMNWAAQKNLFDSIYADTLMLQSMMAQADVMSFGALYNLFVSGDADQWNGKPFKIEITRCIREYTSSNLTRCFGNLEDSSLNQLKRAPCIFAYETSNKLPPMFGYIREVTTRKGLVRIQYDIRKVEPFLTDDDLQDMKFELDIDNLELNRTHWAVKEVNLPNELRLKGISLPVSARDISNAVDISKHIFDVALSFPGETRPLLEGIVQELEKRLGPNKYFYDNNYKSQLAQPSLDDLLQGVYKRARLDVVFLSKDYQKKDWCGVEFRAIKEIIFKRKNARVMFIKTDDGSVKGVSITDGYIDARKFSASEIAEFICERLETLNQE